MLVPWRGQADLPVADALLLHAWSLHKVTRCPACGGDKAECQDEAHEWDVDDDEVCYRTRALERWRRDTERTREPGVVPRTVLVEKGQRRSRQAELLAALREAGTA